MLTCFTTQEWKAVPFCVVSNLDNLLLELLKLQVQITALGVIVGIVDRLDRQLTHALQHIGDFVGRAFSGLDQANSIACISNRLVQTAYLMRHPCGNGHTGSIIPCGIDALACRQLLHGCTLGKT